MPNFFKKYPDLVLIFCMTVFFALLIGYFFWGITTLIDTFNKALAQPGENAAITGYDLKGAAELDLKGLVPKQ